ncbi:MAG: M1 family aminopeptidase [Bacteroidales bacterium]|nr:M1 family aminopeptidase [Bacteroidales bacterium]
MKNILLAATLGCIGLCTYGAEAIEGVDRAMAQNRAQRVSDVVYDLSFNVPVKLAEPVEGALTLQFSLSALGELQLDFCGEEADSIITVNGNAWPLQWQNEHIIIPDEALREGDNSVSVKFVSSDNALNRNEDYMYTLFVPDKARSVFPCFDQPDLKAEYRLTLTVPADWEAVGPAPIQDCGSGRSTKVVTFEPAHHIPTYLFSFAAGEYTHSLVARNDLLLNVYSRETEPERLAQLESLADDAEFAIRWIETYTGMPCPFPNVNFVLLPGYQFGGMEHPGAIQLNASRIFLPADPTEEELHNRCQLIAHEVSHLWWGDCVTMQWFNDVWLKEVFANYFAEKIEKAMAHTPDDLTLSLNFLRTYRTPALYTDRTDGTHPICQELANLKDAGLLYGNIIYDKAPMMMLAVEQRMGRDAFRAAMRDYLQRYKYGNARWADLVDILDAHAPGKDIKGFCHVWADEAGAPVIAVKGEKSFKQIGGSQIPQFIDSIAGAPYACHILSPKLRRIDQTLNATDSEREHYITWSNLYETLCRDPKAEPQLLSEVISGLSSQSAALMPMDLVTKSVGLLRGPGRTQAEEALWKATAAEPAQRAKAVRWLSTNALAPSVADSIYAIWQEGSDPSLTERHFMAMAYHLAIMRPGQADEILSAQRARLSNADAIAEFDFVSRACTPSIEEQDALMLSLADASNRRTEPWAASMLALLNHPAREPQSNRFLPLGLELLPEVKRTGDIFFPTQWLRALLSGHSSPEAAQAVTAYLSTSSLPTPLLRKLLEESWLLRQQ